VETITAFNQTQIYCRARGSLAQGVTVLVVPPHGGAQTGLEDDAAGSTGPREFAHVEELLRRAVGFAGVPFGGGKPGVNPIKSVAPLTEWWAGSTRGVNLPARLVPFDGNLAWSARLGAETRGFGVEHRRMVRGN
jgi:hypothetical protein